MIKNEMIRIQLLRKEKPINTTTDYIILITISIFFYKKLSRKFNIRFGYHI